ncbi:hypothetical protein CLV98_1116 [Dyadobacter jejuensis]|uniref:Uncharacterized protein n=1 Tax=Dyadobacter jejuensis TaxID=1082580 RepID=A0A316AFJ1_9BACT|nr:hypothetical protein CLV98_1116 [Dyadobacter jejuensis]
MVSVKGFEPVTPSMSRISQPYYVILTLINSHYKTLFLLETQVKQGKLKLSLFNPRGSTRIALALKTNEPKQRNI